VHPVADVAGVAVTVQQGKPGIGRRQAPARQPRAVAGREIRFFISQSQAVRRKIWLGERGVGQWTNWLMNSSIIGEESRVL
jgi:hypothetical protein